MSPEQEQLLTSIQSGSKQLNEALYKLHDLKQQKEYLYDTSVTEDDLIKSLDHVLSILQKIRLSIPQ